MKGKTSFATLVKMTKAALKIWQFVAKYSTKPLLSQGVEGDMAMAKNSRRVFDGSAKKAERSHIAFDDKCLLIASDRPTLYVPLAPRVQVVALANWEAAPTFSLDEHLGKSFPKASTDRFLNKCNPFLSGKRRATSDDEIMSEAPTVSTDCSTIPENDVEDQESALDVVEEEVNACDENMSITVVARETCNAKAEQVSIPCAESRSRGDHVNKVAHCTKPNKQTVHWICVGHSRYVKCDAIESPKTHSSKQRVHWVCVGHSRYVKCDAIESP